VSSDINRVHIAADIEAVYDYVTQPARWCEWNPASVGADHPGRAAVGDRFTETVEFEGIEVRIAHCVQVASRPGDFVTAYTSESMSGEVKLSGEVRYSLRPAETGTEFTRTLTYSFIQPTDGALVDPPEAIELAMKSLSDDAMTRLKNALQHGVK
jgi:uncharacterized protein YndB with AHSA1/START domain